MNPAFALSIADARNALAEMARTPKRPERPIVILAGLFDPGVISRDVARRLRRVFTRDAPLISASFFWQFTFDACRDKVLRRVQRRFPSDDRECTVEVDVVGFSMGGLIARYAAMHRENGLRLKINRLFTIGTPHRGAVKAPLAPFDPRAVDMRIDSQLLSTLDDDASRDGYELLPYVRTRDAVVGSENAAPPGREPWWVPNKRWSLSHNMAGADERILADIARRLRGEQPWTRNVGREVEPGTGNCSLDRA